MRMLVVSQTGFGLGIASHLSSEGHMINTIINQSPSVADMLRHIPDIVIADAYDHVRFADALRDKGIKVLGATQWSGLLHDNQDYKNSLIKAIGYKQATEKDVGIPLTVACWFNGHKFIAKYIVFNYTRMMSGDTGAVLDSAGYIAYFGVERSRLVAQILEPLERFLRKANHRGCFSVEILVTEKDVLVTNVSADIHAAHSQAVYENSKMSKSDILLSVFNESSTEIPYIEQYVCGCLVTVYPYPHSRPDNPLEILGLNPFNLKHMWTMDCNMSDNKWMCGNLTGCMGYVTARGSTVQEARRRVYRTIDNIKIEGIQYRDDLGKDLGSKIHQLKVKKLI